MCTFKPHKRRYITIINQFKSNDYGWEKCIRIPIQRVKWNDKIKRRQKKIRTELQIVILLLAFFLIKNGNFRSRELEIYVLQITREHSVSMFVAESVGMNEWIKFTTNSKKKQQVFKWWTHSKILSEYRRLLSMKCASTLHVQLDKSRRINNIHTNAPINFQCTSKRRRWNKHIIKWMENVNVRSAACDRSKLECKIRYLKYFDAAWKCCRWCVMYIRLWLIWSIPITWNWGNGETKEKNETRKS